jgi:hypothetical protein
MLFLTKAGSSRQAVLKTRDRAKLERFTVLQTDAIVKTVAYPTRHCSEQLQLATEDEQLCDKITTAKMTI